MSKHKKQHYIPRCYLKAWCDPSAPKKHTPYIWVFSKGGVNVRNKAPENVFHETDMYTIRRADGERNLVLEHGLRQLETAFATIRDQKLKHHRSLDLLEKIQICAFVAAMFGRTKASREHHREQWGRVLEKMEAMMQWAKSATPEQLKAAARMSLPSQSSKGITYEQVKSRVENPLQTTPPAIIDVLTPLLCKLNLAVLETTDDIGFITSDHPCVFFDPEAYKRPPFYRAPALGYKSTEITLPVSPQQCLCLNRHGIDGYIPVNQRMVDEFNRRTRFHAGNYFIVRRREKKDIWFDPGIEPEDSWEKMQQKKTE